MISGKILKLNGWPDSLIRFAKQAAAQLEAEGLDRDAVLEQLNGVRTQPNTYLSHALLGELARAYLHQNPGEATPGSGPVYHDETLRDRPLPYPVWGQQYIDPGALAQMDAAMRLPVSVAGALLPDAHVGYGLPIGGVLATVHTVIPFAVGVDIACRMRLSVYEVSPILLNQKPAQFENALLEQTRFGMGAKWEKNRRPEHPVLDDPDWQATPLLRSLHGTAFEQLGTSGTGNHFVEWGVLRVQRADENLDLKPGDYLALLSHSGSRAVGFKIADYYSKLAQELHPNLDKSVRHLAWLELSAEAGQEYWLAMHLAGRFASANHRVIHQRVAAAVGLKEVASAENHHNFAWAESLPDGTEVIVHRKGATPAGPGVLGLIPGSMGDPGYVVRGKGDAAALNSASHGAGRAMSRKAALNSVTKTMRDAYLRERGITLLGGGLDEAPQAYKPIEAIIAAQENLVDILGRFTPKIVRMAGEGGEY